MINTSYPMDLGMWKAIHNFNPDEFGCVDMDGVLIYTLQNLRKFVNKPISIHCGYEPRQTGGFHPKKCAVDLHIKGMNLIDQFLAASRFDTFNGIGVYLYWNSPGLHLDTRKKTDNLEHDAMWGCLEPGKYVQLDRFFFEKVIEEGV